MHDPHSAGRYWLLSTAEGDNVESTILQFFSRFREPAHAINALPRCCRGRPFSSYPEVVQERLRRLGIEERWVAELPRPATVPSLGVFGRMAVVVVAMVSLLCLVAMVIGCFEMTSWLAGFLTS